MDHAPVWPAPICAQGLFRPTQNGAAAQPLEVRFSSFIRNHSFDYVVRCRQALNITDQSLYFHLCQLAASSKEERVTEAHGMYETYQSVLGASGFGADSALTVVKAKPSDLAAGIGLTRTGTNTQSVLASLNRLSQTTMERRLMTGGAVAEHGSTKFLGLLCFDGEVHIVLHTESGFLARKVDGEVHRGVSWINMREQRRLAGKPAKRLHAWLSAWASPVERRLVSLDKLLIKVWGEVPSTPAIRKARMHTLRGAVKEVGELSGWTCILGDDGGSVIARKPLFVGTPAQAAKNQTIATDPLLAADAATTTQSVGTTTKVAATPTKVAATTTAVLAKPAPSLDSDELVFAL
ncbi:hypothetical protein KYG_23860 [Acidovorax sp. NO-1]|nr:hypothetical protein KYG_23860 [Acidovorax sp. NO-1]